VFNRHDDSKQNNGSDDEFIWDDYHGDFLKSWPNDSFTISAISDEITVSSRAIGKETFLQYS